MKTSTYLALVLRNMKSRKVVGNAYSDHDLLHELPAFAVVACQLNCPTLAFEAFDYLGTKVMGVPPMTWSDGLDSFVSNMTFWYREVWVPENDPMSLIEYNN